MLIKLLLSLKKERESVLKRYIFSRKHDKRRAFFNVRNGQNKIHAAWDCSLNDESL